MKLSMHLIPKAILVLFLSLFGTNSLAQTTTTGALVGRVKDVHGMGVANVTLTVTGVNLISPKSAISDKEGNFRISYLPPGRCTLSASMAGGFITSEVRSVEINLSRTYSVTLLVRWRSGGNSTAEKGRQSIEPPPVQMSVNSPDESRVSTISVNGSNAPGERPTAPDSRENDARRRAEGSSSAEDKTASGSRVGLSVLSSAGSNGAAPRPATTAAELMQLYRVGIGDVLDIRLRKAPTDRSTLFTVTSHGLLQHPILAHPLKVTDLTPDEIRLRIEAELKKRAINEDPAVLVAVREYVSHTILVSGLVKDPGTKILRWEAIPLYVVLADAQPLLEAGRATIVAKETGEVTTVELSDAKALSVVVRPGDVIIVQATPKQFFYIGGEVKAPGEKTFRPGLTLTQAILAAGGLSRKSKEVQLARESTNRRLVVTRHKLKDINSGELPDPLIQQGDRITVVH